MDCVVCEFEAGGSGFLDQTKDPPESETLPQHMGEIIPNVIKLI